MVKTFGFTLDFNGSEIRQAADKGNKRNLIKSGAYLRTTMRRGIKRRKKISRPGERPHSHISGGLRNIRFAWIPSTRTVVVGPPKTSSTGAAGALEHGGKATAKRKRRGRIRRVRVRVKPRPFALPALVDVADQIVEKFWKDSF